MTDRITAKERYYLYNTLSSLVKALEGKRTTIDLRDDSCVTGKIKFVDGFMNVDLQDAIYYNQRGNEFPFDSFFVKGRNIRYVHIPTQVPVTRAVEYELSKLEPRRQQKPFTFKTSRAKRYHAETVSMLSHPSTSH